MSNLHMITIAALLCAIGLCWVAWPRIKWIFAGSETLFLGRLQVLGGGLMATDLAPILPIEYLPYYVVGTGVITEAARRSRSRNARTVLPDKL